MGVRMRLVEAYDIERLAKIQALYQEAFPASERKPFKLMIKKREEGVMELQALENEQNEFCGLAITILYQDMVLLDYFAIAPKMRGKGTGTEAFSLLRDKYAQKRFFLEIERTDVEAENLLQRQKRKNFYLRNGLTETAMYVRLFGGEMEVLSDSCKVNFEEYKRLYADTFGENYINRHVILVSEG